MPRKRITQSVESDVMFKSDRRCCVCNNLGHHIHHLDGNHSNNIFDNLALLCFNCHNDASITQNLAKKLSAATIRKYRNHQYATIELERNNVLNKPVKIIKKINDNDLFVAALSASIVMEILKVEENYFTSAWDKKYDILCELFKFQEYSTYRISVILMDFLLRVSNETRFGMPGKIATTIHSLVICYFLPTDSKGKNQKIYDIGYTTLNVGFNMAYDGFMILDNFYIAAEGMLIIKVVYNEAKRSKNMKLIAVVNEKYSELESTLNRPERQDLNSAIEIVGLFRENLISKTFEYPNMSKKLFEKLISDSKK